MDLDGGGAGQRLAGAGERAAGGNDQLDGVPDDDGVVQQVPVGGVLQRAAPHELAVAVAVARVGVLHVERRIMVFSRGWRSVDAWNTEHGTVQRHSQ